MLLLSSFRRVGKSARLSLRKSSLSDLISYKSGGASSVFAGDACLARCLLSRLPEACRARPEARAGAEAGARRRHGCLFDLEGGGSEVVAVLGRKLAKNILARDSRISILLRLKLSGNLFLLNCV